MNQRGFLLAGPMLYAAIGAGVVIALLAGALKIQTSRLDTCKSEFGAFKLETRRIGEAAEKAAKEREAADKKLKERTDANHKTAVARLNRDIKRLRNAHPSRSELPSAPATSKRPDLACFERAELSRAFGERGKGIDRYRDEVLAIAGEGAKNTVDLDAAKAWAQSLPD